MKSFTFLIIIFILAACGIHAPAQVKADDPLLSEEMKEAEVKKETTLILRHRLTRDTDLRLQIQMAGIKAANDILSDPNARDQHRYARLIITEPENKYWIDQLTFGVITNPAINADSTDEDIQFTVNSIFEKYALAFK